MSRRTRKRRQTHAGGGRWSRAIQHRDIHRAADEHCRRAAAPAGQVQRVALSTEMTEAESRALGIAERNSRFHSMFQAGERGEPVASAVREFWANGTSSSTSGITANVPRASRPARLDLFSDRFGAFSG